CQSADCHQYAETDGYGNQVIETHGSIRGEIENSDSASLDHLGIDRAFLPQLPADSQQGAAAQGSSGKAKLQRKQPVLGSVLDQKGDAYEENHYSQFDQQVLAAEHPAQPLFKR